MKVFISVHLQNSKNPKGKLLQSKDCIALVLHSLWILGKTTSRLAITEMFHHVEQNRIFTRRKLLQTQELSYITY